MNFVRKQLNNERNAKMKHFQKTSLLVLLGTLLILQGCAEHDHDHAAKEIPAHPPHTPKYNEIMVEFPGHKYAMEIIDEKETTGLVTALITDAHFEPTEVDATEVRLNFTVNGNPKTYTLPRTSQETGKPVAFILTNMELATLCCEGWQGEATASVEINGTPYSSKLVRIGEHDHDHSHVH